MWQLLCTLALAAICESTQTPFPVPSLKQSKIIDTELSIFLHFSMCTFVGCEHNTESCHNVSRHATCFRPTALDADQWVRTAAQAGATQACLTAHHDGGFANWQTNQTEYGVRQATRWSHGDGDVVKEFSEACRRHNISMCFYVSELLNCWESQDTVVKYMDTLIAMLTELLTGYGPVSQAKP